MIDISAVDALGAWVLTQALAATVLGLAVSVLGRRIRHAAVLHTLWVVVLLKLLLPPAMELAVLPRPSSLAAAPASTLVVTGGPTAVTEGGGGIPSREPSGPSPAGIASTSPAPLAPSPLGWLLASLAAGSLVVGVASARRAQRFRRRVADRRPAPRWLQDRVAALGRRLALRRLPETWVVGASISPVLWSRHRRVELLIPRALLTQLDPGELDAVLAHELAHLRRGDHWVRLLELAASVLYWWHPMVWWARRALRRAEERCCDAWVARVLPGCSKAYAEGLLKTLEMILPSSRRLPARACGIATRDDLEERLTMIMTERTPKPLSPTHRGLLLTFAVALLAVLPTFADRPAPDPEAIEEARAELEARRSELELEAAELEEQMRQLKARRRELAQRSEELEWRARELALEAEAEELAGAGAAVERATVEARRERLELEAELRRHHRQLEATVMREREALQRALAEEAQRAAELAAAGERQVAETRASNARLMERRRRLIEDRLHDRQIALHREALERRAELTARLLESARAAADADQAAELERELEALRAEAQRVTLERQHQDTVHAVEARLEALAAETSRANTAEGERHARERLEALLSERAALESAHREERRRFERQLAEQELQRHLAALEQEHSGAPPERAAELEQQIERLQAALRALDLADEPETGESEGSYPR